MVFLAIYYLLVTAICFWIGVVLYSIMQKKMPSGSGIHFLLTGLIALAALGQWIVLFGPVNLRVLIVILLMMLIVSYFKRGRVREMMLSACYELKNKSAGFYGSLICFLIMIVILNAGPIMMDDTQSYHIQMIKWIREYGSVPGIANLHLRFGFNSSWFTTCALLTQPLSGINGYCALNGLISCWFCYFLLAKIFYSPAGIVSPRSLALRAGSIFLLGFCFLNWSVIRGAATSANYDFITTICLVVLFTELFENPEHLGIEWVIWPVYLFTVRMINAPLILLSVFYFLSDRKNGRTRRLLCGSFLLGFLVIPFVIRNLILSGYPFFPIYQLDWFSFDWKADKRAVVEISEYIKYFNRVNSGFRPLAETRALGFPQWIFYWFMYLFRFDRILVIMSVVGYAYVLFKARYHFTSWQRYFTGIMILELAIWFFTAPDPRFVQGGLLFGVFAAIAMAPISPKIGSRNIQVLTGLLSAAVLVYGISKLKDPSYRNLAYPSPLPKPQVRTVLVDHLELHIPGKVLDNWNARCYDVDLPCLYRVDPRLMARGGSIAEGFKLKKDSAQVWMNGEYDIKK